MKYQNSNQVSTDNSKKYQVGQVVNINGKKFTVTGYNAATGKWQKAEYVDNNTNSNDPKFDQYNQETLQAAKNNGWVVRESKTKYDRYGKQSYDPKTEGYNYNGKPLDWTDFKDRHNELITSEFGDYSSWESKAKSKDPAVRQKAVMDFQNAYDRWYKEATGKTYFNGNPEINPYGVDGKFGMFTSSVPGLSKPKPEAKPELKQENNAKPIIPGQEGPKGSIPEVGWFPQDVSNLYGAISDSASIKKYMPWMAQADFTNYEPVFADPTRELANNNEQTNIGVQGANAYATPQAYVAAFTQMQGKSAENAANTLGRYNNMNIGIANQSAMTNAEIDTKRSGYNAERATSLYDKTTIANQQFDNSKRLAKHNIISGWNTGITNSAMANTLNYMNPYEYFIDPSTGGRIRFNANNTKELDDQYKRELEQRNNALNTVMSDKRFANMSQEDRMSILEYLYPSQAYTPTVPQKPKRGKSMEDLSYIYQMLSQRNNLMNDPTGQ